MGASFRRTFPSVPVFIHSLDIVRRNHMAVRVGINGFGRIGRIALKAGLQNKDLEFVAVNDLTDAKTLAHLFKYDSTFGIFPGTVVAKDGTIAINGKDIKVTSER